MPKEADSARESSKLDRTSVFAKRPVQATLHQKKPTSSVEADITGGSVLSSQTLPKQETSTASSKNYTFKTGMFYFHNNCNFCVYKYLTAFNLFFYSIGLVILY